MITFWDFMKKMATLGVCWAHSRIDDLNIDLVVSLESANEIHYELD